jgi:hypothetical protein
MTVDKLIYDVREGLKAYSDDNETSDRYILYLYDIKRAKYLRQDINNSLRTINVSVLQNFNIQLEKVPSNFDFKIKCDTFMRTVDTIPTPLQLHTKTAITRIAAIDKIARPFNFITREKAIYACDAPFPNAVYTFLHNDGRIYIVSNSDAVKLIDNIDVTGVFENPLEVGDITGEKFDMDYPIQPHYIDVIKKEIISELVQLAQIPEDKLNNSND